MTNYFGNNKVKRLLKRGKEKLAQKMDIVMILNNIKQLQDELNLFEHQCLHHVNIDEASNSAVTISDNPSQINHTMQIQQNDTNIS